MSSACQWKMVGGLHRKLHLSNRLPVPVSVDKASKSSYLLSLQDNIWEGLLRASDSVGLFGGLPGQYCLHISRCSYSRGVLKSISGYIALIISPQF